MRENREIPAARAVPGTFDWESFILQDTYWYSSNRTVPKHKSCHRNFLFWVAYIRKKPKNIDETERRTCPLKDCEKTPFDTHDAMLEHLYTCRHLAKGSYKCWDCGKFERISRIHTNGCHELRRFSSVADSLRRAKQLLSSHSHKNRNGSQCATNSQATSEKIAELPTPQDNRPVDTFLDPTGLASELDAPWIPEIHELDIPAECAAYDNYMPYHQYVGAQSQNACAELSASHGSAHVSNHQLYSEHAPAELSSAYNSTWTPAEDRRQPNSQHFQSLTYSFSERTYGDRQHFPQDQFENAGHSYTSYDEAGVSKVQSPVSPISAHDYPTSSLSSSASRTNTDVSGVSLGSFYPSRDTSMSSFSSLSSRPEYYEKLPFRFLADGGENLIFSEPESMEEHVHPAELPTSVNANPLNWLGEESGLIVSEPEAMEELIQPVELPTSSNASSFAHFEGGPNWMFMPELIGDPVTPAEMPTYSNKYSPHFNSAASIPKCFPAQHGTSEAIQSQYIEAQIPPKRSPPHSTGLCDPSSPPVSIAPQSKYKCSCGFESSGKELYKSSNFKRHQSTKSCQRQRVSHYKRPGTTKSWPCPYPGCRKKFTRSDNLRVHQKKKRHGLEIELLPAGSFSLQPEAAALHEMHERHRYQGIVDHDGGTSVWK
jgi:hypothetical protein